MNSDSIRERYAEVTYPGGAFAKTHPARQAIIGRLFGVPVSDVQQARVLEIGCAQGFNLLPLAAQLPGAHFVGVDLSEPELARGRDLAHAAGLTNIEFICADLRAFTPVPGSFDYIIAHGVLSWVPDDAKAALFALIQHALAPSGIAYVSYNTYPGWKQREAVRELMLMHIGTLETPAERLGAAQQSLASLDALLHGRSESHAAYTREIIADMRRKQTGHFYHDELEDTNDPCYFLQFAAWAAEHGLAYLAEAEWESMFPELLPADARAVLKSFAGDRLRLEQHLDFLRNRSFRCSLLVHDRQQPRLEHPDPSALCCCRFGSPLGPPVGLPPLTADTPVRFGAGTPRSFEAKDTVAKALFTVMAAAWPRRLPFTEIQSAVSKLMLQCDIKPSDGFERQILGRLFDACSHRLVDFLVDTSADCLSSPTSAPVAARLTRLMAAQGLPIVNVWHESVPLDDATRTLLATLDGTRTDFTPAERQSLEAIARSGLLPAD